MSDAARTDTVIATDMAQVVVLKGLQSSPLPVTAVTTPAAPATSTVTRVAANAANVTLLAANTDRKGAVIYNNSLTQVLYVKLGATADIGAGTESFSQPLSPVQASPIGVGGSFILGNGDYTGRIDGIWGGADANGEALITELTP